MNARSEYMAALRNYRMSQVNAANRITDRFDCRWNDKTEFVTVSPTMSEIAKQHILNGQIFQSDKVIYINGRYNNRLHYLLRSARK